MKMIYKYKTLTRSLTLIMALALLGGCTESVDVSTDDSDSVTAEVAEAVETTEEASEFSWEESHSNDVEPNYDVVFNDDEVLELYITIDSENWEAMNTDLEENLSSVNQGLGGGNKGGGKTRGGMAATETAVTTEATDTAEGDAPQGRMAPADGEEMPERPALAEGEEMPERPGMAEAGEVPELAEGEEMPGRPGMAEAGEMPELAEGEEMPERPGMAEGTATDTAAATAVEGATEVDDYEPVWVESTITFEGDVWENVGIRFKGNSTLSSVASSDTDKFSFKLDFDEFEDEYTEIEDQRFFGFKQLNLNNNYNDESLLHEALASDLFRDFGIASAETSFAAVYVDYGEGYQYFGLYTIVEEVDDTVLETQFADDDGNLYKPDGDAASFAEGTYDESEMEKKTNEDEGDYSDVEALYTIINSDLRTTDVEMWKDALEEVFDVDMFLKWLAVNTTIVNWDTYGTMTHNFYLYNNPETGLLTWIPWDNNEALSDGKKGNALSLSLTEVSDSWPLISYLIEIPEYEEVYESYLASFVEEVFDEEAVTETINEFYELIQPYAYAEEEGYTFLNSDEAFDNGINDLIEHVSERNEAVDAYLD